MRNRNLLVTVELERQPIYATSARHAKYRVTTQTLSIFTDGVDRVGELINGRTKIVRWNRPDALTQWIVEGVEPKGEIEIRSHRGRWFINKILWVEEKL